MYIEPTTNIRLLKNVPLDNTYTHTIFFSDANSQTSYFIGLQKYNLGNYSYQRVQRGVARVGLCADNIYDCNYMMFQNPNFGNKWFYAFITSVEYVNNVTAEINFEIDVLQTWHFDYSLEQSFIERQHTVTDVVGEHIEPEPVETGEKVFNNYSQVEDDGDPSSFWNPSTLNIVVAIADIENKTGGRILNNSFSGSKIFAFPMSPTGQNFVNEMLDDFIDKTDTVNGIYVCPALAIGTLLKDTSEYIEDPLTWHGFEVVEGGKANIRTLSRLSGSESLDGYTPKNKKMYTYPYNYLQIDNGNGSTIDLRYEFFKNRTPVLSLYSTILSPVTYSCYPLDYKNTGETNSYNQVTGQQASQNTEMLSINTYPLCSWSYDTFRAWMAQQAVPSLIGLGVTGVTSGLFTLSGSGSGPVGQIGQVANMMSQGYKSSLDMAKINGTANTGSVACALGRQRFYKGRMSVTHQYAKMIDDFFSMYGYNIKVIGTPNRTARPHWTYVKTVGVNIIGSVPADDLNKICRIYDKGVTWWRNGSEIGNYSLNNSPS